MRPLWFRLVRVRDLGINEIILGRLRVTADTALRLSRYFGMSPQFWLGLQMDYDLDMAEDEIESQIDKEITPLSSNRFILDCQPIGRRVIGPDQ